MDWTELLRAAWPIATGTPGLIAFWWNRKDRRDKRLADAPYAEWTFNTQPDADGWYATQISIKNRWNEPLYGRHIKVAGWRGTKIVPIQQSSDGSVEIDPDEAKSQMPVDWTFWSSSRTGEGPSSGATFLYIKPPKCSNSGNAASGTGKGNADPRVARLRLEISLISASNRTARVIARQKWATKPITRRAARIKAS